MGRASSQVGVERVGRRERCLKGYTRDLEATLAWGWLKGARLEEVIVGHVTTGRGRGVQRGGGKRSGRAREGKEGVADDVEWGMVRGGGGGGRGARRRG